MPIWVMAMFFLAEAVIVILTNSLALSGVPLGAINPVIYTTIASVLVYGLALFLVIAVPFYLRKRKTGLKDLGMNDFPAIMDLIVTPLGLILYVVTSALLLVVISSILPGLIDPNQAQQLPFSQTILVFKWQYALAFLTLVVLAPFVEELLFRGYLYGKLRNSAPVWLAVIITSLTFGVAHLWAGPDNPLQWGVMLDTFALSLVMSMAREYTGAIWVPIFMHMTKNGIAFYFLFVNPDLINQLKSAILLTIGG